MLRNVLRFSHVQFSFRGVPYPSCTACTAGLSICKHSVYKTVAVQPEKRILSYLCSVSPSQTTSTSSTRFVNRVSTRLLCF